MIGPLALRLIASGPAAVLLVPGGGQRTGTGAKPWGCRTTQLDWHKTQRCRQRLL
ncbi:hypothetical protein MYCTH_2300688 [Thermothelomyces thermophilus ATCC 42464]|uniref:Uncharacterized protein n=1 Tax=Thermothelomyces thermophilus (strain ATCC 42464 / BCRC 31852 / DSM 1799) TaxID=573729 RepID=G2Q7X3_THET4|nr:uncharacterized protein MYCTH_2300688 [Thermothelomyces thermophilus ATCC 42464]AEO56130.1 hypothetical protein MYCTH_2300688 [Thermothelomyces thermophilus ATCC 42464]